MTRLPHQHLVFPKDGGQEREVRGGLKKNSYKNSLDYLPPVLGQAARKLLMEGIARLRDGEMEMPVTGAGWGWVVRGNDRKDER